MRALEWSRPEHAQQRAIGDARNEKQEDDPEEEGEEGGHAALSVSTGRSAGEGMLKV